MKLTTYFNIAISILKKIKFSNFNGKKYRCYCINDENIFKIINDCVGGDYNLRPSTVGSYTWGHKHCGLGKIYNIRAELQKEVYESIKDITLNNNIAKNNLIMLEDYLCSLDIENERKDYLTNYIHNKYSKIII